MVFFLPWPMTVQMRVCRNSPRKSVQSIGFLVDKLLIWSKWTNFLPLLIFCFSILLLLQFIKANDSKWIKPNHQTQYIYIYTRSIISAVLNHSFNFGFLMTNVLFLFLQNISSKHCWKTSFYAFQGNIHQFRN